MGVCLSTAHTLGHRFILFSLFICGADHLPPQLSHPWSLSWGSGGHLPHAHPTLSAYGNLITIQAKSHPLGKSSITTLAFVSGFHTVFNSQSSKHCRPKSTGCAEIPIYLWLRVAPSVQSINSNLTLPDSVCCSFLSFFQFLFLFLRKSLF